MPTLYGDTIEAHLLEVGHATVPQIAQAVRLNAQVVHATVARDDRFQLDSHGAWYVARVSRRPGNELAPVPAPDADVAPAPITVEVNGLHAIATALGAAAEVIYRWDHADTRPGELRAAVEHLREALGYPPAPEPK